MKNLIRLLISTFFISKTLAFQASYDQNLSPQCGAENLSALHYNFQKFDDYVLDNIKYNPLNINNAFNDWKRSILRGVGRTLELNFIWAPLNDYLVVIQHEFFGHGYRIRDFGKDIIYKPKYKIFLPYPFGDGGGYTSFKYKKFTPFYSSAISICGTEATSILAKDLKLNWLKNGQVNPLQATLYLDSFHDLTFYTLITQDEDVFSDDGNDIGSYVCSLLQIYPTNSESHLDALKNQALINFFDPFTYLSIYSYFKYIVNGKSTSIPMIPIMGFRYLPAFRFGLSPFGPEIYFENYISNDNGPMYLYFKKGSFWENEFYGIGLKAPYLLNIKSNFFIGMNLDLWKQPLFLGPKKARQNIDNLAFYDFSEEDLKDERIGGSLSILASYKIKNLPLYFDGTFGYKTKGFVPGESLKESPILRLGLSGTF